MAITDVISRVIVQFKGDTSDLKSKMKDLRGEEKKFAEEVLKHVEARNKSLDEQSGVIGKVGNAFREAVRLAEHFGERQRLSLAAGITNIEALRKASMGLRSETELMTFAAKTRNGVMKADTQLMEHALRAMRQLERAGHDQTKVMDVLTEAMVGGEIEGFKKLGIQLRETKTDAEKVTEAKRVILDLSSKLKDGNLTEAESFKAATVAYQDSMDKLKASLGELAIKLEPVVTLIAKAVSKISELVTMIDDKIGLEAFNSASVNAVNRGLAMTFDADAYEKLKRGEITRQQYLEITGQVQALPDIAPVASPIRTTFAAPDNSLEEMLARQKKREEEERRKYGATSAEMDKAARDAAEKAAKIWEEMQDRMRAATQESLKRQADRIRAEMSGEGFGYAPAGLGSAAGSATDEFGRPLYGESQLSRIIGRTDAERLTASWNERLGKRAQQKSKLEAIFGPVSEFDAYAKGFQMLQGAAQTAFTAWIDGSMSAGEAVKKFFAESLKGIASDMLGRAIQHGAMAVASLIPGPTFNPGEAAGHGAAAAKFAAGAAAVGLIAKALSPGASAPAGGAGAAASGGSVGGGAGVSPGGGRGGSWGLERERGGSSQVMVVVTGDPFAMDSPRARAANIRRVVGRVVKNGVAAR